MAADEIEPMGQDSAARAAGQAKGGTAPQPGEPTSPREARARAAATDKAMKDEGFGDDKGADY